MRQFTARYLEGVAIGTEVFEDVVLGELARPNLTTVVVEEVPGWISLPSISTVVAEDVVVGRMSPVPLIPFSWQNAGEHKQTVGGSPVSEDGYYERDASYLSLAVDTPLLIETRVLKFTVTRTGSGSGPSVGGWRITAVLTDGTEVEIIGTADIPEGETEIQVTIDLDELELAETNYISVGLFWSWGSALSPRAADRVSTAIEVTEDAPFYTRSLVHEPWLYWGDSPYGDDLSGNGRVASGNVFGTVGPGAPGCYGSATIGMGGYRWIRGNTAYPTFDSALEQWSVSLVFRISVPVGTYHRLLLRVSGVTFYIPYDRLMLGMRWAGEHEILAVVGYLDWHHLVVTFDGSQFSVYLNGAEVFLPQQPPLYLPDPWWDGAPGGPPGSANLFMVGGEGSEPKDMDDFAVWDRALSLSDVQYIYAGLG